MPTKIVDPLERFKRASTTAAPRIIGASVGPPGSGKTHFWLTAPEPIVLFSFDFGTEGTVDREEFRDKDIRVVPYEWIIDPAKEDAILKAEAVELRNQFKEDYFLACAHARTVVIDKETELWNLVRYAEFGSPKGDVPRDFDKANQYMRMLVNYPKKFTINAGFIEDTKEEWAAATRKSGDVKRAGFRELEGLVNVDLWHTRLGGGDFSIHGGKAKGPGSKDVQEKDLKNLDFATLGMLLFPDTDESDWK